MPSAQDELFEETISADMKDKNTGKAGEDYAAKYLKRRGYLIIARNYAIVGGELDIVALKGRTLVFVEVKTRSSEEMGSASAAVDIRKQNCLKKAKSDFLSRFGKNSKVPHYFLNIRFLHKYSRCRFDIIEIYFSDGKAKAVHKKDAFS